MNHRSPRELIEIYWDRVYNAGEFELVREVCADPIIRHDPGLVTPLDHDEQIVRIKRSLATKPLFTHQVLHADDRFVTSVWNMVSRDGRDIRLCGIEVFEAHEGRFTRCWNSSYMKGFWGEDGDVYDPSMLDPPALIASPGEITANWLERAFAAGGAVQAERLAQEPVITPIGHGTTSTTVHIRATYNSGHIKAPTSAICKIGVWPQDIGRAGPFERERQAYALFGPEPAFRVPRLYYGATDEGCTNLLLEDMSAIARPGDQITGCSVAEAGAVVRELARFHAFYRDRTDLFELDWLSRPEPLLSAYAKGAGVLNEWLGGRVPAAELGIVDAFGALAERWIGRTPGLPTLIHGDIRADNVLFEGEHACLIDWQSLSSGDALQDVAYFLSGSVTIEDRRTCERDIVAEHSRLLGVHADIEDYRRNIASGLWLTVIAAAYVTRETHNADLLTVLVARNTAAIRDWDALATLG